MSFFKGRYFLYLGCILTIVCSSSNTLAQEKDTTFALPLLGPTYKIQLPSHDMADRFGWNSSIGASFVYKLKSNLLLEGSGHFLFSSNVKETQILDALKTEGFVVDLKGQLTSVFLEQRGFSGGFSVGYLWSKYSPNNTSGITVLAGPVYLQHKIRIAYKGDIPQLSDVYKKGYDRLTRGVGAKLGVGYLLLGNNKWLNFHVGYEYIYTLSRNVRGFNYDTGEYDNKTYKNGLHGLNFSWLIPFRDRPSSEYYYY